MGKDSSQSEYRKRAGGHRRGGRKARPPRCTIQVRAKGKDILRSTFSFTVDLPFGVAMKMLQETFAEHAVKYSRATDDPRWLWERGES